MNLGILGGRALVTGGTRGIGRAVVTLLAEEGCSIEFCARTESFVSAAEAELTAAGYSAKGSAVDLAEAGAADAWAADAVARLGGLDLIVANASAMETGADDEAWKRNYRVEIASLRDLLSVTHAHLKNSVERRGDAAVVVIGSTSVQNAERVDAYGAVKAALVHTVKGLSRSLIEDGIRVNMVSPGPVFSEDGVWARARAGDPERYAEKLSQMPLGRMGMPGEVANAVVFLCSPRARYIVGSNIVIDGGRSGQPHY